MKLTYRLDGEKLKELRRIAKLEQVELAKNADVAVSIISNTEQGRGKPATLKTVRKLATALGVTPEQLLLEENPNPVGAAA